MKVTVRVADLAFTVALIVLAGGLWYSLEEIASLKREAAEMASFFAGMFIGPP